jgi:hypothetical protein
MVIIYVVIVFCLFLLGHMCKFLIFNIFFFMVTNFISHKEVLSQILQPTSQRRVEYHLHKHNYMVTQLMVSNLH